MVGDLSGTVIDRYRIERELGRGGMSVVYLATDLRLRKQWAVKVIRREGPGLWEHIRTGSLLAEAGLMKELDHPALPRVVDILEQDDALILVMDYVRGESLSRFLERSGPADEETVRDWMRQLAQVLAYLHGQDPPVIYRDMKPENVIRRPDGTLVLIDFGISRTYREDSRRDTVLLGTEGYAAPEQHGGAQTDARADIYALGMAMAEMLTGVPPGADPYRGKPHPFRKMRPGVSARMEAVLNRCIAPVPEQRYASCEELLKDLDPEGIGAARKDAGPAGRRSGKRRRILLLAAVFAAEVCAGICSGSGRVRDETAGGPLAAAEACIGEHADGGLLSDEDGMVLLPLLDERPELWEEDPAAACAACFEAGKLYLYRYTGAGGSFRSRLLLAQPFFERAAALREEAERRVPAGVSETPLPPEDQLESYIRLCGFFLKYVYGGPPLLEPERDEYGQILNAAGICLAEQTIGTSEDGAYLRLLLYQSIAGLLNEYRQGMAASGIGMEAPAGLLERIREQTEALMVGTERLYRLQQTVAAQCREYEDNMARTYQEVRKWADAGKEEGRNEEQKE